ncbi:hypothetical protein FHX51_000812 [Aeriscardovia aeriphila]|uniref:Uncharacterized protein n=1 Tax=Aeriscardovia aeriphila TaxID=218139 RepID=A0A261FA01_9BIFI|nr:hypothetical protein [Aeriscardovia aeriphila]OZG55987.1 hypothetical protein AEAE_0475 [Aeriscardovia aeriphila]
MPETSNVHSEHILRSALHKADANQTGDRNTANAQQQKMARDENHHTPFVS